jgi:hypothetical protein
MNDLHEGLDLKKRKVERGESTDFLSSMTFALQTPANCGCDECGTVAGVPPTIADAIQSFKRQRALKRAQNRQLVKRKDTISIYEWALPMLAEPLLEFGSSHRFIYVKRLPGFIQTIGQDGIVGSRNEEMSRLRMSWKQGDVVLVPSNGGRAVGFVHVNDATSTTNKGDEKDSALGQTFATLTICKIPAQDSGKSQRSDGSTDSESWYNRVRRLCFQILEDVASDAVAGYKLDDAHAEIVKECMGQ